MVESGVCVVFEWSSENPIHPEGEDLYRFLLLPGVLLLALDTLLRALLLRRFP